MMSVLRALAGKELQQHAVMLLWLTLFSLLCAWMLFALYSAGGGGLSYLSVTSTFANLVLVVVAFVVGQQLVAAEYYGRTQRFIETLPARHGSVHWVKYWFGYLYLFVMLLIVWYPFKVLAQASETVSALFAGIMLLRMAAFVFALWSIVFAISLLGRLRLPLIATAAFAIVMINNYTDFELNRFGPMALMDQPFQQPSGPDGWPEKAEAWLAPQSLAGRIQWAMAAPRAFQRSNLDPREFVKTALGDVAGPSVLFAAQAAESKWEGIGLILASPDFNRR